MIDLLLAMMMAVLCSRADAAVEVLALRQQLAA
jgi:hypothetical protein